MPHVGTWHFAVSLHFDLSSDVQWVLASVQSLVLRLRLNKLNLAALGREFTNPNKKKTDFIIKSTKF